MRLVALFLLAGCDCGARSHPPPPQPSSDAGVCEDSPTTAGCPCSIGAYACYEGSSGTEGVGTCHAGVQNCPDGTLRACTGQVVPVPESCNGLDDDCDGERDEDGCARACVGVDCGGFGPLPEGFRLAEDGALGLALPADDPDAFLWAMEVVARTAAKVDTRRREVVARYRLAPGCPDDVTKTFQALTVDDAANAYVGMHERDVGDFVVAIANRCEDLDGDGVVETSSGPDDVRPFLEDECVRWSVDIPESYPLAVERRAIDGGPGSTLWVGDREESLVVALDPATGERIGEIDVNVGAGRATPSSITFDGEGRMLVGTHALVLGVVDTQEGTAVASASSPLEAPNDQAAQDWAGRVWFGGRLQTYDPVTEEWTYPRDYLFGTVFPYSDFVVLPTGLLYGIMGGRIRTYDPEADAFGEPGEDTLQGYSLALDRDGLVWEVEGPQGLPFCGTDVCCEAEDDTSSAWVRDPWTDERTLALDETLHLGLLGGNATGVVVRDVETAPRSIVWTLEGCPGARWAELGWESRVPDGTSVRLEVDSSDAPPRADAWTLAAAQPPGTSPVPLADVAPARYLLVRATLEANGGVAPDRRRTAEVVRVEATYACP